MNLFIFPKARGARTGTSSPSSRGSLTLLCAQGSPSLPVHNDGERDLLQQRLFIPKQKGIVYINIGAPVEVTGKGSSAKARLMDEVRDRIEGLTAMSKDLKKEILGIGLARSLPVSLREPPYVSSLRPLL